MQIAPGTVILSAPFHYIVVFEGNRNLLSYFTFTHIVRSLKVLFVRRKCIQIILHNNSIIPGIFGIFRDYVNDIFSITPRYLFSFV